MADITLKHISDVLGINVSTVSRALKDHPDISAKTKKRVQELADMMDYVPNLNAINLRTSDSKLLGVIVPSIANVFYNSFVARLEEECRAKGFSLLVLQSNDEPANELSNLRFMKQNRIGGLFICLSPTTTDVGPFLALEKQDIPVIFFDKTPLQDKCNRVTVADGLIGDMCAKILLDKKKKNILALFADQKYSITQKRESAFRNVMENASGRVDNIEYVYPTSSDQAQQVIDDHLNHMPEVIFCMSDEVLVGVMRSLQKAGKKIPEDVSVLAISDGFIPSLYYPRISYVETSGAKLANLAFSSMMASRAGSNFEQELVTEVKFIDTGSI